MCTVSCCWWWLLLMPFYGLDVRFLSILFAGIGYPPIAADCHDCCWSCIVGAGFLLDEERDSKIMCVIYENFFVRAKKQYLNGYERKGCDGVKTVTYPESTWLGISTMLRLLFGSMVVPTLRMFEFWCARIEFDRFIVKKGSCVRNESLSWGTKIGVASPVESIIF